MSNEVRITTTSRLLPAKPKPEIKKPAKLSGLSPKTTCPPIEVALFTRQLHILVEASIPLVQALHSLKRQTEGKKISPVVNDLINYVSAGSSLSKACSAFPRIFSPVFHALITIGENTGQLDTSLDRIATWMEADILLKRQVKAALTYPVFILLVAFVLTLVIFWFVLPNFTQMFEDMHIGLPLPTLVLMAGVKAACNPYLWCISIGLILQSYLSLSKALKKPAFAAQVQRQLWKMPVFGTLLQRAALARYFSAMEAMVRTGNPLARTVLLAAEASASAVLIEDSARMYEELLRGNLVSDAMLVHPEFYPPLAQGMISIGEEVAQLDEISQRLAAMYFEHLEQACAVLTTTLEPILIGLISFVVGGIVLAVFLPLYNFIATLGG